MDSACFSFLHVVHLYHAKPPEMGLGIVTDKSIIIDPNIVVSAHKQPSMR